MVVRNDLPLAHQAVQAVHAGIASARELIADDVIHPSLVLCTVPDRDALMAFSDRCIKAGVKHSIFNESDMGGQPTALATEPIDKPARKWFKDLPLFTGAA